MNKREIKFRAWDEKQNKMLFWENRFQVHDFWDDVNYPESIPVMQYTGLKDKNGTPIFEGDIVRSGNDVYKVDYVNGTFLPFGNSTSSLTWSHDVEVIGNIYETPELLKGGDKNDN